eukprot:3502529-Rhodomonas_salina.1
MSSTDVLVPFGALVRFWAYTHFGVLAWRLPVQFRALVLRCKRNLGTGTVQGTGVADVGAVWGTGTVWGTGPVRGSDAGAAGTVWGRCVIRGREECVDLQLLRRSLHGRPSSIPTSVPAVWLFRSSIPPPT